MVLFNPSMLGAKKSSSPFGMTKTPIEVEVNGVEGSSPIIFLASIIGSIHKVDIVMDETFPIKMSSRTLEAMAIAKGEVLIVRPR